ncbi:HAD family hydrolase [Leptospira sp. WS92.C1]
MLLSFVLLLSFNVLPLFSQTDPLLRGSWYENQEEKEAILYNRVMKSFRSHPHFVWKTDLHGRNYRFYKDGRVEFLIDREYREVFPDVSELDIHRSEVESLAAHGDPFSAIRLSKGIGLCYRFQFGKLVPEGYQTATKELSRLMRHMAHKAKEVADLSDPYGCSKKKILKIESETFRFSLEIENDWKHFFPDQEHTEGGTEGDHTWKVRRFYKSLPVDSSLGEWETAYKSQSEKKLYYRPDRILFTIGMSYHPVASVYTSKNYFQLWDLKRGINPRTIQELNLRRKKEEDSYTTRFNWIHPDGRRIPMIVLEKYYLRENRGLLLSISAPEKHLEQIRQLWVQLNGKLIVE